jgi:hypothetical protein
MEACAAQRPSRRNGEALIGSPDVDLIPAIARTLCSRSNSSGPMGVVYGTGNQLARHAELIADNREGVMAMITFTEIVPKKGKPHTPKQFLPGQS